MFMQFDPPLSSDDFISIVILSFTRPNHLRNLVQSIHQHADMPFEIIISDDGSHVVGGDAQIFNELRPLSSTMIFNNGANMGFAASANKGTSLANSNYVLLMNDDTLMSGPSLRMIRSVLATPYVGSFGPWRGIEPAGGVPERVTVRIAGFPLQLSSLSSGSSIFAFRKSLWRELGGFPQVYHNGGDIAFIHKSLQHGYFSASNTVEDHQLFRNVDVEENYKNATYTRSPFDSSYPHVFGVQNLAQLHMSREERVRKFSHDEYVKPFGLHNSDSWKTYIEGAKISGQNAYDWDKLSLFKQDKWRELVEKDLVK